MHPSPTKPRDRNSLVARLIPFLLLRRYEPGERVPSERELADRFGVSRGQIREALSYLEALRVIERRAKSGVYMAAEESSIEALALFAQLGIRLTASEIQQSVEMRRIHEVAAIRLACERRNDDNLARLSDVLAAEAIHVAAAESIAAEDRMFHTEIVRCTQNRVFVRIINVFFQMTAPQRTLYFRDQARARQSHEEHLRLFDAIAARQTAHAEELMKAHLQGVDRYWQSLAERDGGWIGSGNDGHQGKAE